MKQLKYLIPLCIFSSNLYTFIDNSFMTYRSQGFDFARNNAGYLKDYTTNTADVTVEYTRSFDSHAINNYFFGSQELIFSGSRVAHRGIDDILADYFGLPTDFKSSMSFSPQVQNVIADVDFYWLLGCCSSGFDLRINIPFVHSKWSLDPCENVIAPGTADYPAGYMSKVLTPRSSLKNQALDVLSGQQTFGDLTFPLQYGRIACGSLTDNKIADIYVALGYNIPCTRFKALHVDLNVTIPTGTIPNGTFLFAPQVGNGRHWAFGGSFNAQYDFINNNDCCYQITAYFDATIQHLFKSTQKRSYDLINNGPGSRYMLLEDMLGAFLGIIGFSANPLDDPIQNIYNMNLLYVIDATTLNSKIKINAQADIDAKLAFTYNNFSFSLGYNLWVRSAEKLVSRDCLRHQFYGIKGDAQVYGFIPIAPPTEVAVPINATQSLATLHKPQGNGNTVANFVNNNADNPMPLFAVTPAVDQTTPGSLVNTGVTSIAQINGSDQSVLVADADINNCSGLSPRAFTNKIFGSIEYDFETCDMQPYLLLGGQAEFAGKTNGQKTAISQWGIWLKGGISY
jgi:hypothetical protein